MASGDRVITVRFPAALQIGTTDTMVFTEPLATIAELIDALERRLPGFRDQLEDSVFNFAVNDELVLYHALGRALADGDVVELVPAISGG
jgi:molybdopterin converting factor small subunit